MRRRVSAAVLAALLLVLLAVWDGAEPRLAPAALLEDPRPTTGTPTLPGPGDGGTDEPEPEEMLTP